MSHVAAPLDDPFFPRLIDLETRGVVKNAEEALNLMASESGLDSSIINSIGCAGLNQMCSGTLQGWFKGDGTTDYASLAKQFAALPASGQLDAIEGLWTFRAKNANITRASARDLYWLNFLPATFTANAPDAALLVPSTKLPGGDAQGEGILKANPGLRERDDVNGLPIDGQPGKWVIRAAGLQRLLDAAATTKVYKDALVRLEAARSTAPIGPPAPLPAPTPSVPDNPPPTPVVGPPQAASKTPVGLIAIGIGFVIAIVAALLSRR